ncbi:sugar transporter domain-containing protein [Ditylenchus destructor]|nr:sugar transporter domain-containing protein [Ditylenchus destructor]
MVPNGRALLIISIISFASNWQFGYQITYINTASVSFYQYANDAHRQNDNHSGISSPYLSYEEWSNEWSLCVASFYPGTFLGFILVPFLIRRVGVKQSLLYSAYPAVIGCFAQLFIHISSTIGEATFILNLAIGRFLVGIQAGCSLCLLPLFIIEASTEKHRPFLSSLQQVSQALSTLIGLLVGSDSIIPLGPQKIQWLQIFGTIPICAFIIILILLPETPLHLLENAGVECTNSNILDEEIKRSALFYYGNLDELHSLREDTLERWGNVDHGYNDSLTSHENLKGLLIGSLAAISFAFTADDLIDSFSSQLLYRSTNGVGSSAQTITVLLGVWLLIASVCGAFVIDRFGRKKVLIFGLLGTAFSNLIAALGSASGSVPVVTIGFALTKTFIGVGAGGPAWFLTSELVSSKTIWVCQSISTGSLLIMTGIITLCFLPLESMIGGSYSILLLASFPALVIAFLLTIFLPETKDRRYDEIRQQLGTRLFSGIYGSSEVSPCHQHPYDMNHKEKVTRYKRLMSDASYASYGSFKNSFRNMRNASMLSYTETNGQLCLQIDEFDNNHIQSSPQSEFSSLIPYHRQMSLDVF